MRYARGTKDNGQRDRTNTDHTSQPAEKRKERNVSPFHSSYSSSYITYQQLKQD